MIADYLFAFVVLLSVLIFVHELGHFLVAKACGVRVLKFSLGFGSPIGLGRYRMRWKRGHTEYAIAWFPLGGFVKMLGEHPDEAEDAQARAHPGETLEAQPLWQKLAIVFAGPLMNLLLPVVIFAGMQAIGLPRAESVIGLVEAGSPAEAAGLAPGDRVTAVAGEPIRWWSELAKVLRESPGRELTLRYQRDGQPASATLAVESRDGFDDFGQTAQVGWAGLGHSRPRALVGILDAGSPAQRAGLRSGDGVTAVAGQPVEDWYGFRDAYATATGETVALDLRRVSGEETEEIRLEVPALGRIAELGIVRASALVEDVVPDSPAARAGLRSGDLILEYDGRPVSCFSAFARDVAASVGRPIPLVFARQGERREITIAAEPLATDTGLGVEETRYRIGIRGSETLLMGSVVTDRERNPLRAIPRAAAMTVEFTRVFLVGFAKIVTGEVSSRSLAGPIGIAQIAGNALQQGWEPYLRIMVVISINLGILNLLPIPILDGGQAALFLVEGIRRSPLSLRTRIAFQQVGVTVLILLMALAFWNDLSRLWAQVVDWLPGGM